MCGASLILGFDVKSYKSPPLLAWKYDIIAGCIFFGGASREHRSLFYRVYTGISTNSQ